MQHDGLHSMEDVPVSRSRVIIFLPTRIHIQYKIHIHILSFVIDDLLVLLGVALICPATNHSTGSSRTQFCEGLVHLSHRFMGR